MKTIKHIRKQRTKDYSITINGLLTKRAELFNDIADLKKQISILEGDISGIDRSLGVLGYEGELDSLMPRRNKVTFPRGELTKTILKELRLSDKPLSSRDLACSLMKLKEENLEDRKMLTDFTSAVSTALVNLRTRGVVLSSHDALGHMVWEVKNQPD